MAKMRVFWHPQTGFLYAITEKQTDKTSVQNSDPKQTKVLLEACLWDVNILPKLSETLNFLLSRPPMGFPASSVGKEPTCNAGDLNSIPGLARSPGEGKGYPLSSILFWRIPWSV